ncbi:MAG: exo-alpha-sialidase [Chitinophagaceae bacterium]|nr:MAG: exo-alpha-sialidase [Chitinophagaceae bacterium]
MTKLLTFLAITILVIACDNPSKKQSNLSALALAVDSVSGEPYLFTDSAGVTFLSWVEKGKEKSTLSFSRLNDGAWSKPTVISSGDNWFINWADYPMLASDGSGGMIAHFLERSEKGKYTYDVKLVTSKDGGTIWSTPKILNEDGKKAEHGFVSLIPYGNNFFVAWLDGRNAASQEVGGHSGGHHGQMTLRAAIIDKLGTKLSEWELDNRVCDCCQTTAAITANGPVVMYRDRSESEIRDIAIVRFVNGQWTEPKTIVQDNWTIAGCPVNGPRVDARGNNMAVARFTSPDKKGQVSVVFSQDGGATFGAPIRVDGGETIGRVDIILLDDKTAMVSWMEGDAIKAAKVHADGTKEPSITIASSSQSRSSGFPQMTKSVNSIVFAWTDDKLKKISTARLAL